MAQVTLDKKTKNSINQYLKEVKSKGIAFDKVILFGSYAKGKAKPESDIDLAIISRYFGRKRILEMKRLRRIAYQINSIVEPLPLNPQDLNERYSSLVAEINKYGQIIPF